MTPSPGTTRRTIRAADDLFDAIAARAQADDTDVSAVTRMLWEAYCDLSSDARAALKAKAARDGTTLTAVIVAALERYVAEEDGVSH